jgi:hypothetical protein
VIEIKPARNVPGFRYCPVCRTRLAPRGSNVTVTIDAENEATAIKTTTHTACARTIIEFTRARGYTPAELAEVGIWAEEQR